MLRAYSGQAVRAAEEPFITAGQGPELMRRAAHGLALAVRDLLRARGHRVYGARVLLLVGAGNNGGDALYAGATLAGHGVQVTALLAGDRTHPAALTAFHAAGGRTEPMTPSALAHQRTLAGAAHLLVDGLLGTGGRGGLREPAASLVAALAGDLAQHGGPAVVACDLPSGVDATTGEVHGPVLPATVTVTFGALKTGLLSAPGEQLCGALHVVELGLRDTLGEPALYRLDDAAVRALLPRPAPHDHKYTRGVAGIVAGSARYPGAALLAVAAASACGPGMVRYLGPASVAAALAVGHPEVVCAQSSPGLVRAQAWLIGPGLDDDPAGLRRARQLLDGAAGTSPVVVDAAALALLAATRVPGQALSGPPAHPDRLLLTPHAGELAQLLARYGIDRDRAGIEAAPVAAARQAAALTGATVLLKGATTVIAAPDGTTFTQAEGTPALATAGSGDTLAGILVALLALTAATAGPPERPTAGPAEPPRTPQQQLAVMGALAATLHGRLARREPLAPLQAAQLAPRIPGLWAELLRTR